MICADSFFTAALGVFILWMFLTVALQTRHPELWAGMSRAVELPCSAIGAVLGAYLLRTLPGSVTLLAYVSVILLTVGLFYRCFLLYSDTLLKARKPILLPRFEKNTAMMFANAGGAAAVYATPPSVVFAPPGEAANEDVMKTAPPVGETNYTASSQEERLRKIKTFYNLSVRETEVLLEILQNHSINEMAENLFISPRTVKFHISSLLRKTGASSQHHLKQIIQEHDRLSENK